MGGEHPYRWGWKEVTENYVKTTETGVESKVIAVVEINSHIDYLQGWEGVNYKMSQLSEIGVKFWVLVFDELDGDIDLTDLHKWVQNGRY